MIFQEIILWSYYTNKLSVVLKVSYYFAVVWLSNSIMSLTFFSVREPPPNPTPFLSFSTSYIFIIYHCGLKSFYFYLFNVLSSVFFFDVQIVSDLASGSPFKPPLLTYLHQLLSSFLLPGIRYFRLTCTLHAPDLNCHFSQKLWLLSVRYHI